ncbi:hypothetical protein E4U43_002264 [Claviceps pusilla]|uniref:Stress-associated endoplasmic reticulum protein n=1 Tax=Claviceps pusilla TaxID=123648 RepID=A0A9P7N8L4_9HYPO|nr:hypothetical protein E4U43_002264 [Claviceps pusilla]
MPMWRCQGAKPIPAPAIFGALAMAQTLEQRRRNAKFAKEQESRMGKSDDQIKKRVKETHKSPISPIWIG